MSVAEILHWARTLGVRLWIEGDRVKMKGPADALAKLKPEIAANKPEIMAFLKAAGGVLIDPVDGARLPWGAFLSADDVFRLRAELAELIEDLADAEDWTPAYRDEVLARAMRGPLSDVLPNLAYFRERVAELYAECEARQLLRRRSWRMEGFDDRRATR